MKKGNWNKRYRSMKTGMGWTNTDVAEITGNTPDSVKTVTRPGNEFPRAYKLAIVVYEELTKHNTTK